MIIVPSRKAVVLKAGNPQQILSCIATAKTFAFKGQKLVYVPHKLDETKVLRNLGCPVPSPMGYQYAWPKKDGKYDPYEHQRITSEFATYHNRLAILNAPRTGKTNSCLWTADYLMNEGVIRKVLIVGPLSTLERVWNDEIFSTFWWRKAVVLHGDRKKRMRLVNTDADFYIVNHDGFNIVKDHLPPDIDLIIYDEAAVMRNPSTNRFRAFNAYMDVHFDTRLWLLTGTPTPNEPTDAWALCKLLKSPGLPRYTLFRDMVMMKVAQWTWRPKPGAEQIVSQYLQPSIRYTRDECFDLPDTTYETRQCEMSANQRRMVTSLMRQLAAELQGKQVTAVNEASKIQKILQVLLGVVYTDDGGEALVDCESRVSVIREVIEQCSEKVLVFVPFTGALHGLAAQLERDFTVAVVDGTVSPSKRNVIFQQFQMHDNPRVIVANARTMQHGLDMTAASTIIWAGPTNSNETYEQACDRIKGAKQKHKTSIIHIESTEIERRVYKRLKDKQGLQGLLLDIISNQEEYI